MSRYPHIYKNLPKIEFRDSEEKIKAISFALNHFREIQYTCGVGYDFRDHWNDLVIERINLLGKNDGLYEIRK